MLYDAFEKICNESDENDNHNMTVDRGNFIANSRVVLGSILEIELVLRFFADEVESQQDIDDQ